MRSMLLGAVFATFAMAVGAGETAAEDFKALDVDADGKLSKPEVVTQADLKRDFRSADSNSDGYVSNAEFDTWLAARASNRKPPSD